MSEDYKYTYSLKRDGEMFVIRSNSLDEIFQDREDLYDTLAMETALDQNEPGDGRADEPHNTAGKPDGKAGQPIAIRSKRPYKYEGDRCGECGGTLVRKQGENSTTKAPFDFLGCSNFPTCAYTAYISKFEKKKK